MPFTKINRYCLTVVRNLILIALLAAALPALGGVFSSYEFKSDSWPVNERVDYKIQALEEKASGTTSISIRKITQMDTDMFLVRYEGKEGNEKDKWEVKLKKADLMPVSYEETIQKKDATSTYSGAFHGKEMTLTSRSSGAQPKQMLLSRGGKYYLSMVMPYLLRSLNYKTGDYYTFHMLIIKDGSFTTPIIQVKEKEVLEVPAGIYECWKLNIKIGSEQNYGWYSVKPPHFLVKYRYPDKELIMVKHY